MKKIDDDLKRLIDLRILKLITILESHGQYKYSRHFCQSIGMVEQNFTKVRAGTKHFTPEHIYNIIQCFNINANWIFKFSTPDTKVFTVHK